MYQNENTSNEAGAEGGILVVANHWRWVVLNTAAKDEILSLLSGQEWVL
jgi:hypothetical protein